MTSDGDGGPRRTGVAECGSGAAAAARRGAFARLAHSAKKRRSAISTSSPTTKPSICQPRRVSFQRRSVAASKPISSATSSPARNCTGRARADQPQADAEHDADHDDRPTKRQPQPVATAARTAPARRPRNGIRRARTRSAPERLRFRPGAAAVRARCKWALRYSHTLNCHSGHARAKRAIPESRVVRSLNSRPLGDSPGPPLRGDDAENDVTRPASPWWTAPRPWRADRSPPPRAARAPGP